MSNDKQSGADKGGISFCSLLLLLFIGLKLGGVINWSWWWVLSPFWIPLSFACVCLLLYLAICLIEGYAWPKKKAAGKPPANNPAH